VIFDNAAQRYVSNTATGKDVPPAVTADIDRAEVWTANDESSRRIFKDVLKELNKQPWLNEA
jgi:poly-gamma-glutamate capsule biosynthesis protein CapA/YwtB (metallophosphatase superfamily)